MAFKTSEKQNENKDRVFIDLKAVGARVANVRQISDSCIVFTLRCKGFSFYNMKLYESKDGKEFIAGSQTKGSNGKWYNNYAIYLSEEDQKTVKGSVLKALESNEK